MAATFYAFRRSTGTSLGLILVFAVLALGASEPWAWAWTATAILALGSVWAVRQIRRPSPFVNCWMYAAVALPLIAGLLQLACGVSVRPHSTAVETLRWLAYLTFFALCVNVMVDSWLRRSLLSWLMWVGVAAAVLGVAQKIFFEDRTYNVLTAPGGFSYASFADREHFAVLIELIFPPTLVLALRESEQKIWRFGACLAMAASLLASGSWVGVMVVAGEFGVITAAQAYLAAADLRRKGARTDLRVLVSVGGMVVLGLALIAAVAIRRSDAGLNALQPSGESLSRGEVAHQSLHIALEQPLLGHGLGTFDAVFAAAKPREDGRRWVHSGAEPVEWLVEAGAFGFLSQFLVVLLLAGGRKNLRTWMSSVLPLAAAWTHSWIGFPFSTPAVVLTALVVLAQAPVSSGRTVSRGRRRSRRQDPGTLENSAVREPAEEDTVPSGRP